MLLRVWCAWHGATDFISLCNFLSVKKHFLATARNVRRKKGKKIDEKNILHWGLNEIVKSSHLTPLPSGYIYWKTYKSPTLHQEMDCTEWPQRTFPSVPLLIWCRHRKTELAKQYVFSEMMDMKGEDNADRNNYLI